MARALLSPTSTVTDSWIGADDATAWPFDPAEDDLGAAICAARSAWVARFLDASTLLLHVRGDVLPRLHSSGVITVQPNTGPPVLTSLWGDTVVTSPGYYGPQCPPAFFTGPISITLSPITTMELTDARRNHGMVEALRLALLDLDPAQIYTVGTFSGQSLDQALTGVVAAQV